MHDVAVVMAAMLRLKLVELYWQLASAMLVSDEAKVPTHNCGLCNVV